MTSLLFIVSRTKPGTYAYMELVSASEHDVILDRRKEDRRRIHQRATPERRHGERRRRDIAPDLQKSGWGAGAPSSAFARFALTSRHRHFPFGPRGVHASLRAESVSDNGPVALTTSPTRTRRGPSWPRRAHTVRRSRGSSTRSHHPLSSSVVARPTLMRLEASQFRISQLSGSLILWTRAWTILPPAVVYGWPMTSHSPLSSVRRSPT